MGIKTFNIDEEVYKQFSAHCKKNGVSMSKRVENFIRDEVLKINAFMKMHNDKKASMERTRSVAVKSENANNHTFSKYC